MPSRRLAEIIAQTESSMADTAKLIRRIQLELRPLQRAASRTRQQLADSHELLRRVGSPWRVGPRDRF